MTTAQNNNAQPSLLNQITNAVKPFMSKRDTGRLRESIRPIVEKHTTSRSGHEKGLNSTNGRVKMLLEELIDDGSLCVRPSDRVFVMAQLAEINNLLTQPEQPTSIQWTQVTSRLPTGMDADPWGDVFLDVNGTISRTSVRLIQECANKSPTNDVWSGRWMPTGFGYPETDTPTQTDGTTSPPEAALTYQSSQHTLCAGCGKDKHTPLRIDWMDGYVCLTCIDKALATPPPPQDLSYKADLYDRAWNKAQSMGYPNITTALEALSTNTTPPTPEGVRAYCKNKARTHFDIRKEKRAQGERETAKFHEGCAQMATQMSCDLPRMFTKTAPDTPKATEPCCAGECDQDNRE